MRRETCPDQESLRLLLLGKISWPEAEPLEEHLLHCDECSAVADTMTASDELTAAIGSPDTYDDDENLRRAIERAKKLRCQAETLESAETFIGKNPQLAENAVVASSESSVAKHDEELDFLSPAEQPNEIGRLGGYRVLDVIGVGGMGIVFRAEDPQLKRQVALKAMKPAVAISKSAKERFLREAQATASIEHDNIVSIYQVGEESGIPFIAMQFLQGESLRTQLRREGRLDQSEILRLGREVAAGLVAAHERGLIHRDIKPDNIWIERTSPLPPEEAGERSEPGEEMGDQQPSVRSSPGGRGSEGRAKILDFGLVCVVGDDAGLTQSGMVLGTPNYMSPEQAHGEAVDHRCDLFSLGGVLYCAATGKAPFSENNIVATLVAVTQQEPEPIENFCPEIDPELGRLIVQLLSKERGRRPQSASEVVETIAGIERRLLAEQQSLPNTVIWAPPPSSFSASQTAAPQKPASFFTRSRLGLVTAIALVLLPLCYLFGGTIIRFTTNQGLLVVEVDDRNIEIAIKQNGLVVKDKSTNREFQLKAVTGEIEVYDKASNLKLLTKKFALTRGGKAYVTVTHEELNKASSRRQPADSVVDDSPKKNLVAPGWQPTPEQQKFFDAVAKLEPAQQIEAVRKKLKELNPNFDGKLQHTILYRRVVRLRLITDQVTDISPVRALPDLEKFDCSGLTGGFGGRKAKGRLADLSPLQGMKLTSLSFNGTRVDDLSPLQGMPLTRLSFSGTPVADLSPLRGMKLTYLMCLGTRVTDLSPLQGMPLTHLDFISTRVGDISPLRGMKLTNLRCGFTRVADFSPLEGMQLTDLYCVNVPIADFSPLQGMPLRSLHFDHTEIVDLSPLRGMPLTNVSFRETRVTDLSPLKGMPLAGLVCFRAEVSDLSPLRWMPLTTLTCDVRLYHPADDALLNSLSLQSLNSQPVAEIWKKLAARRKAAEEFVEPVAKLSAKNQTEAVLARFNELNPGLRVTLGFKVTGLMVTEATLALIADGHPHDLTPLMAFIGLKKLTIGGGPNWLDLSPLTKLPLEELTCREAMARKNSPVLKGIKTLKTINGNPATDYWKGLSEKINPPAK